MAAATFKFYVLSVVLVVTSFVFVRQASAALIDDARFGRLKEVRFALAAGYDVHKDEDEALRAASKNGHSAVVDALLAAGADVHAKSDESLWEAAVGGHTKVVVSLLQAGADENVSFFSGSALARAAQNNHVDVVKLLVKVGATDINSALRATSNLSIIEHLLSVGASADLGILVASQYGFISTVRRLVDERNAKSPREPVSSDVLNRALLSASENGHAHVVDLLLKQGADANYESEGIWGYFKARPLSKAADNGHADVVSTLLKAGANARAGNYDAMKLATAKKHETVIKLLKEATKRVFLDL